MILHQLSHLNWVAVVVATFTAFLIGSVWFTPQVALRRWAAALASYTGKTIDELLRPPTRVSIVQWLVGMFLGSIVVGLLVHAGAADSPGSGAVLGLVLWAGIGATFSSWPPIFGGQPWRLWAVNNSAYLLMLVAGGTILGAWR